MTIKTDTKPADTAKQADAPAPVLQSNGVDTKPAQPSNVDSVAKAEASKFDRDFAKVIEAVGTNVEALVAKIVEADTPGVLAHAPEKTVWEVLEYRSLKMYVIEAFGDVLKGWDQGGRDALLRLMVSKGFTLTDAAQMTGASKATATRTMQKARAAESGKPATAPKAPSTPADRAVKALETLRTKAEAGEFTHAELRRIMAEVAQTLDVVKVAENKAPRLHASAEGTTATGVGKPANTPTAPKPAPAKAS